MPAAQQPLAPQPPGAASLPNTEPEERPVETADIVVPAAHCEIVYEIPINR
ncbi:hypothetical protein SANTM175S_01110 [Streptomyces antimycoticus]